MSTAIEVNGVSFLSIKDAASRFHYTRDYVARLAREEKITAVRVGRQWLVDPVSLERFAEVASLEQVARQNQLSLERKRERLVKEALEESKLALVKTKRLHHPRALRSAVTVAIVAVVVGYGGVALAPLSSVQTTYQLARTPAPVTPTELAVMKSVEEKELPVVVSFMERPVFEDSFEVRSFTGSTTGVLLLPTELALDNSEAIAGAFSDEVIVRTSEDGRGTVSLAPAVEGGVPGKEIPFVAVPVRAEHEEEVTPAIP